MKKPDQTCQIDPIVQTRLNALERLINSEYEGKPSVFESKTGIKMAQVNQWFSGYRALRDKALKRLEEKSKKPAGWFDTHTTQSAASPQSGGIPPDYKQNQPVAVTNQAQTATNDVASLGQNLTRLNLLLSGIDGGTRETIASLIQESICKPDKADANIAAIEALMRFATAKVETASLLTASHP